MVLDRIGPKDIEAYDQELAAETTDHERRVRLLYLRQILAAAAKPDADGHSVIKRSPFDVRIPPVRRRSETEPATAEELRVIHDSMPRHLRLAITLAIAAGGLRIGEVCGLQRQDIDLDRRTITIRRPDSPRNARSPATRRRRPADARSHCRNPSSRKSKHTSTDGSRTNRTHGSSVDESASSTTEIRRSHYRACAATS